MGATPRATFSSLTLPEDLTIAEFDALIDGLAALAERERAPLAGGNIARSPGPLVIDITVIGSVHPRRVLKRTGGRPGDELYVTGSVGGAAAGLALLRSAAPRATLDDGARACLARLERPEPRVACGVQVARNRAASAGVDLSDGLADAARQLAAASGTGVVIDADAVPVYPAARALAEARGADAVADALTGGEDYELLFAVPPRSRRAFQAVCARCRDLPVTRVGRLTAEPGAWLHRDGRSIPLPEGFTHF
jgi:thiamine-monophosphate kinase